MALAPLGTPTKAANPTANTFILPRLAAKFITPIQCNSQDDFAAGVSWRINVPRFPTITSGNCFSGYATWDGSRHLKYLRQPHLLKSSWQKVGSKEALSMATFAIASPIRA